MLCWVLSLTKERLLKNGGGGGGAILDMHQHIRMISEGSRDTEDRSNDAGNSALHHRN